MRRKLASRPGEVAGPSHPSSAERSSGTTRVGPSAWSEAGKTRQGRRGVRLGRIGLAAWLYSKNSASRVASQGRSSAASAGAGAFMTVLLSIEAWRRSVRRLDHKELAHRAGAYDA